MMTDGADALKAVEEAARAARGTVADLAGVPASSTALTASALSVVIRLSPSISSVPGSAVLAYEGAGPPGCS